MRDIWFLQSIHGKESMAERLRHWTLVLRVPGLRPTRAGWLFVSLDKTLYSNCSMVRRSRKAVGPIWSTFHILSNVKERHGLFKKSTKESSPVPLTVCQNMSPPLRPEWAKAIPYKSPAVIMLMQLLAVWRYEDIKGVLCVISICIQQMNGCEPLISVL